MNNNSFIVAWNNRINSETNSNIYAQRYLDDGSRVGNNFIVTYDENKEQRSSSIGLWNNQIYTVWEIEHIDGIGYNQYMNILNWDVTVPVELCNFRTITHDDVVILNWETLSESNNYGFEVQRMISDKDSWETIGFVNGKGTTNVLQSYSYKDKLLSDGEFLYRLKQIDFDGSFIYSDSICVSVNKMITNYLVQNYPNPFNSSTTVSFNLDKKDNVKLNVYNTLGQKVKSVIDDKLDVGSHQITINMNDMTSGLYFCRLEMNERVEVKKILLQK